MKPRPRKETDREDLENHMIIFEAVRRENERLKLENEALTAILQSIASTAAETVKQHGNKS